MKAGTYATLILTLIFGATALAQSIPHESKTATLSAVKLHYLKAGTGKKTLVVIHGFGDTSHMWIPLFDDFGKDYTIIAPDMRGLGDSSRPASGYDKKTIAADIHELVKSLGYSENRSGRPRHRLDGGLRLRRTVSE